MFGFSMNAVVEKFFAVFTFFIHISLYACCTNNILHAFAEKQAIIEYLDA